MRCDRPVIVQPPVGMSLPLQTQHERGQRICCLYYSRPRQSFTQILRSVVAIVIESRERCGSGTLTATEMPLVMYNTYSTILYNSILIFLVPLHDVRRVTSSHSEPRTAKRSTSLTSQPTRISLFSVATLKWQTIS